MEKLVITKNQEESLNEFKREHSNHVALKTFIDDDPHYLDFTVEQFSLLLNGWYEVESEPFKEGDWVTTSDGIVGKLVKVPSTNTENDFYIDSLGYRKPERRVALSKLKHSAPSEIAEEKERRWWKKHGRDVWELKSRDVILEVLTRQVYAVDYVEGSYVHFSDSDYDELSNVKNGYIVLIFAESRLDVKTNE